MTTATKAIAGIGWLLATATVPSVYLAISSSSSSGEKADKVDSRKTGTKWLTSSGYTFNPPQFTRHENLDHGCAENLFSNDKEGFDPAKDTKLYGCAVMKMDLWNMGNRFNSISDAKTNIDPKWIQFNSEIAIRKGNEGWVINTRFDNLYISLQDSLAYMLTTYKYESNKWQKNGEPKLWIDSETINVDARAISVNSEQMETSDKRLMIKVPEGTWFDDSDWISTFTDSQKNIKKYVEAKGWSGVWINDENKGSNSWIFKDIELYIDNKKYSQIFWEERGNDCFQSSSRDGGLIKNPTETNTWLNATNKSGNTGGTVKAVIPETVKGIIGKLKDSRGSWKKLKDICETEGDLSEEQKNQLRMYCSKGKKVN